MGMEGKNFGELTLSVVIYDEDRVKVEHAVTEFQKLFTQHDGLLYEERYNLLNAFFATIPGNRQFNLRKQWALNSNYADLSFLFTVDTGSKWNPHLEREYLAVLESTHGTPYYLNLHSGDVAHTLMLGATGAGKSFAASTILQSAQKYEPLTFVFDLGGSYEALTRAFNGTYLNVGLKSPGFSINPFSLEPTHETLNFLYLFLRVLIESGGRYELSTAEEKALYATLERIYKLPREIRTLTNFASILGPLGERLHRCTQGGSQGAGQFGYLFDNIDDTLTFSRFQTFNFDGWSAIQHGALLGAAGDGRVASAARADDAEAAVAVLTSVGHEGKIYELAGDHSYTLTELAAEVSKQTGKTIVYNNVTSEAYEAALIGFGLPGGLAAALADADLGAARGELDSSADDLSALLGKPSMTLAAAVAGAF